MASSKLLAVALLVAASVAAYALLARGDAPNPGAHAAANAAHDGSHLPRVLDADTQITLPTGFDAEVVYTVPPEQGSWVAMAFDPKGRLIVSDQDSQGVFRVTLPAVGAKDAAVRVESLPGFPYDPVPWGKRTVGGALGFLWAFDSLYMSSMKGFFRIRDTDGDDAFDEFTKIRDLEMGYEHSAHSIVLTEDDKGLYLVSGNHSRPPAGTRSLQPPVWREDSLLPNLRLAIDVVPAVARMRVVRSWAAIVNGTQDWRPILGALPGAPGVFLCFFPWMGFTAGPHVARLIAELALGRRRADDPEIAGFAPGAPA